MSALPVNPAVEAEPTRTYRVCDRGTGSGYSGVTIRTVVVSANCPTCGGPRGEATPYRFCEDGEYLTVDRWENPCGHIDMYAAVLAEARIRLAQAGQRREMGGAK
ncbi:hypothetical protein ACH4Q7_22360 [Streptomyces roseolus]|uniref:hypothetical protein n=1 Tax=Streptomyces roseolus TaxID=67358 RepID=UPI0037BB3865